MILALAACAAVLPTTPVVSSWGDSRPSSVILRADDDALAVVEFVNTLTGRNPEAPFRMTLGDLTVTIHIEFGRYTVPDTITLTVPEQYIAVPPVLVVDDGTTGTQRIYCADALPLG
jgi:hypothetical protein